jgi:hypothetical protein
MRIVLFRSGNSREPRKCESEEELFRRLWAHRVPLNQKCRWRWTETLQVGACCHASNRAMRRWWCARREELLLDLPDAMRAAATDVLYAL